MLRVRSLGSSGRQGHGFGSVSNPWSTTYGVQTFVPYPYGGNVITIEGMINEGSADEFGDRQCAHVNVAGELFSTDGSVITESTIKMELSTSYVLVSGTLLTIPRWVVKRSTGALATYSGLNLPVLCAGTMRISGNIVYRKKSEPHKWYETDYLDIGVDVDGMVHTYWYKRKSRTSNNAGVVWSAWTESTTVVTVAEYDLTSKPPRLRTITNGVPGSWSSLTVIFAPCRDVPAGSIRITGEQARAIDSWLAQATPEQQTDLWGELCQSALQDARSLSINTGMYLYELATIGKTVKATAGLLKGKITPKTLASLYLTDRYGVRLTMADTKSIIAAASRELHATMKDYSWVRSQLTESMLAPQGRFAGLGAIAVYHYKVYYSPYDHWLIDSLKTLMDIDLFPTLTNAWDFVPFSFVLDWFVDIGSLFEKIDTRTYASTLWVRGTLSSIKRTVGGIPAALLPISVNSVTGLAGVWSCTSYTRTRSRTLILPRLILDQPREFSNYAELAAIIATKL